MGSIRKAVCISSIPVVNYNLDILKRQGYQNSRGFCISCERAEASANSPVALQALIQKERIGLSLIAWIVELYLECGRLVSWHEAVTLLATIVKDLKKGLHCRIPRGAAPVLSPSIVSARLLARGYGRSEDIAFNASATLITSLASLALR